MSASNLIDPATGQLYPEYGGGGGGATRGGASYNPNYSTAIASTAGGTISPASFTNSCQT